MRNTDEIAPQLNRLKASVQQCSAEYIAKIEAVTNAGAAIPSNVSAEQAHLNKVVAALIFD